MSLGTSHSPRPKLTLASAPGPLLLPGLLSGTAPPPLGQREPLTPPLPDCTPTHHAYGTASCFFHELLSLPPCGPGPGPVWLPLPTLLFCPPPTMVGRTCHGSPASWAPLPWGTSCSSSSVSGALPPLSMAPCFPLLFPHLPNSSSSSSRQPSWTLRLGGVCPGIPIPILTPWVLTVRGLGRSPRLDCESLGGQDQGCCGHHCVPHPAQPRVGHRECLWNRTPGGDDSRDPSLQGALVSGELAEEHDEDSALRGLGRNPAASPGPFPAVCSSPSSLVSPPGPSSPVPSAGPSAGAPGQDRSPNAWSSSRSLLSEHLCQARQQSKQRWAGPVVAL